MKKVQIDPATQRRPTSRKQNRSVRIKEQLTQQVEVQVIPAKADMEGYERPKPRVCAYCRVSTDMDTQALSYELQVQNYTEYITSNPDWEFAGIYADRGISGTSLRHRDNFNRMIADCEAGKIDLIVTKAVTRFARNVVDAISTVRKLKQLSPPVGVYFETERINTLDTTSETYLGLISLFAQGESESKSESLKWSYIRRWKTITTIAVAGTLYNTGNIKRLLVVSPKSIVQVWQQEFEKFAAFPYSIAVLDGDGNKKIDTIRHMDSFGLAVIVVNYESCWRLEAEIARWKPDMIVCDESSKIKNPQAKCSKALHRLGKASRYNLILTGTPITNSPLDFFSQYKFLDESIFGSTFYGFRSKYAILGGYQNHQIIGYKHLAELVELAHSVAFRIRIDEAVELPEFVEEIRPVKLEKKAQQIYDGIDKDSFAELMSGEVTARNVLTRLLRLSQCTGGFIRDDEGSVVQEVSKAKLEALEDIIDECMEQGKKVVVFARFVPEIDSIAKMLQKKKIGYALIKGDVTDRAEQVDAFQNDPDTKVFIGQLQTTGMGLTLTASSVAVYYSLDFSYANYEQSRARIRRIGQTKRGVYIHLVCKDTIDEKVMAALKQKADVSKLLVDDYKKLIGG